MLAKNLIPVAFPRRVHRARTLLTVGLTAALSACGSDGDSPKGGGKDRIEGQSEFQSIAPSGAGAQRGGAADSAGAGGSGGSGNGSSTAAPTAAGTSSTPRTVEETDLYRLEGDRLYYLNGYRGLMVFDVSNADQPKLLGRSPIYGTPVEMIVRNGVATVVVADWYGTTEDGTPFHGSIVRGIDANDPTQMRILGDAKLGGWVRDTRVVGDVLYAVSEEYGWSYGYYYGAGVAVSSPGGYGGDKMVVSSVSFAGGQIQAKGRFEAPGYGGVFNVTPDAILFAHDVLPPTADAGQPYYGDVTKTALEYIDIRDPGGQIQARGHLEFDGRVQGWGTDNGRWNLDFADGVTAHAIGCDGSYCGGTSSNYVLATADFTNPDAPVLASRLVIPATGWTPAARFDKGRMYLAPSDGYYSSNGQPSQDTPIQVYDLSNAAAPKLAGSTAISGTVWNFIPSGDRVFALGSGPYNPTTNDYGQQISLRYLDVSDAANPKVLGTSNFGEGWAWTPAAGTFKAFTKDDTQGLVVLPFSGWSQKSNSYNNGLQLIEFTPTTLRTAGTAKTRGWVERGIFVKNRLVSLSDLALSVVDYTAHDAPTVVAELTLARNVIDATPNGETISQLSTDWWGMDVDHSELRVLPIAEAEENTTQATIADIPIPGVNARAFHNGDLTYVVSDVRTVVDCATQPGFQGGGPTASGTVAPTCYTWHQQVQVIGQANGTAVTRGKIDLPDYGSYYGYYGYYGGFEGCYYWDWYNGDGVVQVGGDVLAFRRWTPNYATVTDADGGKHTEYVDSDQSLFVVDLANPDAPGIASTRITEDPTGWWGDMRAVGNTLYTSHYEWIKQPTWSPDGGSDPGIVRYYLDRIDLSDRRHPAIGAKINVPGMLVGGSDTDPSLLYTIDYRWYGDKGANEFDVVRVDGGKAYLQGVVQIPGWAGQTFVRGDHAYMSVQHYPDDPNQVSTVQLYQLDLTDPHHPAAQPSASQAGWGWLLGVEGDRALVTSGWGSDGLDIYRLSDHQAPVYDQFVRTRGWGTSSLSRQGNQIFLSSGYWGVQTVHLAN